MDTATFLNQLPLFQDRLWAQFLVIVAGYALVAIVVDLVLSQIFRRLAHLTTSETDDKILDFIHTPIYYTVLCVGLLHGLTLYSSSVLWKNMLLLGKSLILLLWLITLIRLINFVSRQEHGRLRAKIGRDMINLAHKMGVILLLLAGSYLLLSIWHINLAPLLASAGIAGIAIAMAAKDTLANFLGGISLFADTAFKVGDYIIIDNSERGEVVELGIRSTKILTRDDVLVSVPNSILANTKIINESAPNPIYRVKVPVGVAYGSNLDQVEEVLMGVGAAHAGVVKEPGPRVRVRALADSSVNFELLVWVRDPRERGLLIHELLKMIYQRLAEEKITIPFPQRVVHLAHKDNFS